MSLGNYDSWKLATPPEYEEQSGDECGDCGFQECICDPFGPTQAELDADACNVRLSCLARNLRDAGALCWADKLGYDRCAANHEEGWRPGCNKPASGEGT